MIWDHDLKNGVSGTIGGKAAGLLRLLRADVAVPRFFVIPPECPVDGVAAAWRALGGGRVAVRSSAVGEDGAEHSFAGMYASIIGVKTEADILAAVQTCRDSAQSERLQTYLTQKGLPPTPVAVIVQVLAEGESSGVMFSADPMDPERVLISAGWGLGEGIVQGAVPTDTFRVNAAGAVEAWLVDKDVQLLLVNDAPAECVVPQDRRHTACLTDSSAVKLAAIGRRLSRVLGGPQDIEWTVSKGRLVILQTRPITQPIPSGRRLLWDNANIIESYFGLTGPLTYSFASHAYTIVYQLFCEVMGVDKATIQENAGIFPRMIGLVRGRIYYNLNAWYTVVSLLPGYRWNRTFLEQMMGVSEVASDVDVPPTGRLERLTALPKLLKMTGGLLWRASRLDADVKSFHTTFESAVGQHAGKELTDVAPFDLLDIYADLERQLLWAWSTPIVNDFFVMIFHGLLRSLCGKWVPGAADLHNALLAGEGGIISTAPATEAVKLANQIRTDAALAELFLSDASDQALLDAVRAHPRLSALFEGYLVRLGDRCTDELKLEVETLRHRPDILIRTLRSYISTAPADLARGERTELAMRKRAEMQVAHSLTGWRARVFDMVLRRARRRVADRENLRFLRTRIFALVREIFRALGRHMVQQGDLDAFEDIFYLTVDEAFGWVRGTAVTTNLRGLAALRRAEYDGWRTEPPPADRFHTWGPIWAHNRFVGVPARLDAAHSDELVGLPACPGLVEGTVRRIVDPREEVMGEDEILVAYRTDPGWISLFPKAQAVLVERGSLLSHSAVVARELGIPTIVGIAGLMDRLRTGDRIRVDAAAGRVEILESEE
ncbi:MAG: PEP/pyruvate-binding domain-containing protein [Myxococcota bacterium]|nr:PEP/pyruvate-binding domain-containing protein [Myxococcota bacterium]